MCEKTRFLLVLAALLLPASAGAEISAAAAAKTPAAQAAVPEQAGPAEKLAIKGYDPVAYFLDLRAEPGSEKYEYTWKGMSFRFASADHVKVFKANPEKYAPQYGGYSAFDIYHGRIAEGDPTLWSVYDGKLYLNASEAERKKWLADLVGYIETSDSNWPKMKPAQ